MLILSACFHKEQEPSDPEESQEDEDEVEYIYASSTEFEKKVCKY